MTATAWDIQFFQRHPNDDPNQSVPAKDFLDACPVVVQAKFLAVLKAVADAPPPMFSGGGKWEAMHQPLQGFYEIRVDGPGRRHYRLFCLLERQSPINGLQRSSIILLDGRSKAFRTKLKPKEYSVIRKLGEEFRSRLPRSVLR